MSYFILKASERSLYEFYDGSKNYKVYRLSDMEYEAIKNMLYGTWLYKDMVIDKKGYYATMFRLKRKIRSLKIKCKNRVGYQLLNEIYIA